MVAVDREGRQGKTWSAMGREVTHRGRGGKCTWWRGTYDLKGIMTKGSKK